MDDSDGTATAASRSDAPTIAVRSAVVHVRSGPDAGRQAVIDRPTFVIGTGEGADLRLTDSTASREHLRVSLTPEGVHVLDESSKNGTWLGEIRVSDLTLVTDVVLRVGATTLAFRVDGGSLYLPLSQNASFGDARGS